MTREWHLSGSGHHCWKRLARHLDQLHARHPQFRNAMPSADVVEAARRPGLRLTQVLKTFVQGYADRPALEWRARELTSDPANCRRSSRLLPCFETITYRDLWANVPAIAAAWRRDPADLVAPGQKPVLTTTFRICRRPWSASTSVIYSN